KNKDLNSETSIFELNNINKNVLEIIINEITSKISKLVIHEDVLNFEYVFLAFNYEFKDDSNYV
ncbi:13200_t:CDS:2, partial [Funneliformis mosseae]